MQKQIKDPWQQTAVKIDTVLAIISIILITLILGFFSISGICFLIALILG